MEYIVQKIGMSRVIDTPSYAVTILKVIDMRLCQIDGDKGLVAYAKGKKLNKPMMGNQKKYNIGKEYNRLATLSLDGSGEINFDSLAPGATLKVSFKTKGRGFSGVMKRWNCQGGPATHGSRFHRGPGSIGNREWPGRVQPGKKMAGHYGDELVSVNAKVVSFDKETNVLVLKGSVSGHRGAYGRVKVIKKGKGSNE